MEGLEFIGNASRYTHTHYAYVIAFILYSIQVFSSHDMIKFRITKEKEKEKEEDTIKRPQQNVSVFFFQ